VAGRRPSVPQEALQETGEFLRYWFRQETFDRAQRRTRLSRTLRELRGMGTVASRRTLAKVNDTGRDVADTIASLGTDTVDTARAGIEALCVLRELVAQGKGRMSASEALASTNMLGNEQTADLARELEGVDIQELLSAEGRERSAEEMMRRHRPIYIAATSAVCFFLWLVLALVDEGRGEGGALWYERLAGLETLFPERTLLLMHRGCEGHRTEVWRWWTYQFTHGGITHIGTNVLLTLLLGIPLEGFHGTWRMFFMFNAGVFGGACNVLVWDAHRPVAGMSGGAYALFGMHLSHLIMNWGQKRFRKSVLAFLLTLALLDALGACLLPSGNQSHAVHFGGYVSGACASNLVGISLVKTRWKRWLRAGTLFLVPVLITFALGWGSRWPPQNLWESEGWCEAPP